MEEMCVKKIARGLELKGGSLRGSTHNNLFEMPGKKGATHPVGHLRMVRYDVGAGAESTRAPSQEGNRRLSRSKRLSHLHAGRHVSPQRLGKCHHAELGARLGLQ